MEVLSEHLCQGWLEGYVLTGRHGIFVTYEAFAMVTTSMVVQHTKWLEKALELPWRKPIPSLNLLLTSTCWRNDHNGFSHQGPGLIDTVLAMKGTVGRVYLPPDVNCLLSVADHCFRSRNYVNLIVIDKQPQLQWLDMDAAIKHCAAGASVWEWASNDRADEPDVVLAAAGDIPTQEVVAAAWLLRKHAPSLKVRVVNVVDLMCLPPPLIHPHGLEEATFIELFTEAKPVVFAFHGYQRAVHEIIHGRTNTEHFHVPPPRRGSDNHSLRHGRPQQDEPLPPVHGGAAAVRLPPGRAAHRVVPGDAGPAPGLHAGAPGRHAGSPRLGLDRHLLFAAPHPEADFIASKGGIEWKVHRQPSILVIGVQAPLGLAGRDRHLAVSVRGRQIGLDRWPPAVPSARLFPGQGRPFALQSECAGSAARQTHAGDNAGPPAHRPAR